MRVGQSPFSAHQAGMSALWHDADYIPEEQFRTPVVQQRLEDFATPHEQHQLPEGVEDPFSRMDTVFEAAALQMDRGIKGSTFLHGRPPAEVSGPQHAETIAAALHHAPAKGSRPDHLVVESVRADLEAVRLTNQAAATPITVAKNATRTAAEREAIANAPSASSVGDGLATAGTFAPLAVGQGLQHALQGPLPALASHAVTVTGAAASAAQMTAVGIAEGLREEPVVVRRGIPRAPTKLPS